MTLHLHIGAHKTATTHLQATLIKHREQLTEAGVQFERPNHIRSLIGSGRRAAAQSRIFPSVRAGLAVQRLARIDAGKDRLVLSDENSLGQCIEIYDRERLYPTVRHRMKIWRRLAAQRDTTIYLSIRNYADFSVAPMSSQFARLRFTGLMRTVWRPLPGCRVDGRM